MVVVSKLCLIYSSQTHDTLKVSFIHIVFWIRIVGFFQSSNLYEKSIDYPQAIIFVNNLANAFLYAII